MTPIHIKGTSKTPLIDFTRGSLQVAGRSIPEDAVAFFQPLIVWLEKYLEQPEAFTKVILRIEYINSGSNRFIYSMLKMLDRAYKEGHNISIAWHYEEDDDTIKNLGKDMQSFLTVPFTMVEIP